MDLRVGCKVFAEHTTSAQLPLGTTITPTQELEAKLQVCPGRPFGSQRALKGAAEGSSRWTTPPFLSIPFFFC